MKEDLRMSGLELDIPFRTAATIILKAKAKPMFALEKVVRSGKDVEALHDMRVASRRVREAMEIFQPCYEPETFNNHYREVRRVTRTLGRARNLDVCIGFFSGLQESLQDAEEQEAVTYLLDQQKKERERVHRKMVGKLDKLDLKGMRKSLVALFSHPVVNADEEDHDLLSRARGIVEDRLENVFGYRQAIEQESDVESLHQIRIATKKLRYAMETLYVVFEEDQQDELYNTVKDMQERLGNIHDLDVFLGMVGDVKEEVEDRKRTRFLVPGVLRVAEGMRGQRHELYEGFMTFIQEQDDGLKDRVLKALKTSSE